MNKEIRDKYYRCLRGWVSSWSKNKKSPGETLASDRELVGQAGDPDKEAHGNSVPTVNRLGVRLSLSATHAARQGSGMDLATHISPAQRPSARSWFSSLLWLGEINT